MVFAVCFIVAASVIPSLTYNYDHYFGATVTVIHCGYNRDWEIEPKIPLAVVEISTSAPIQHKAWGAIRLPGEAWYEDSATYRDTHHIFIVPKLHIHIPTGWKQITELFIHELLINYWLSSAYYEKNLFS